KTNAPFAWWRRDGGEGGYGGVVRRGGGDEVVGWCRLDDGWGDDDNGVEMMTMVRW
ncbi:hypothetical protein Tco_1221855, partial [Tanacetum coccineum]